MKRAANRKSASTSRARKKAYVDEMTAKNERMKQHALILSMLPDLVLAVCRSGEMTYVSPSSQWLLLHSPQEVTGANIFELVTHDCHPLLRKMISDNLSRPVKAHSATSLPDANDTDDCSDDEAGAGSDNDRSASEPVPPRGQLGNHRERFQQRYRQQAARSKGSGGSKDGRWGAGGRVATPSQTPKMLRLIRCDKTTVWCESRLSVRTAKSDSSASPTPLEIILTLRTVSEGSRASMAHGLAGTRVPKFECPASTAAVAAAAASEAADDDAAEADEYVGVDDDGYQCEVDEEDSNNSGSGNDSGSVRTDRGAGKSSNGVGAKIRRVEVNKAGTASAASELLEGREERSLSKKRQRVSISNRMEDMISVAAGGGASKSSGGGGGGGEDDSSTGGDTGGSTTQEGSGSCSNEVDSNGEGSNNGSNSSKWGDGCGGDAGFKNTPRCGEFGGSEDGSCDGSSAAGTDLGDEVQSAVQSLILMGGSFSEGGR